MKIAWEITQYDVRRLQAFVAAREHTAFVKGRRKRNLETRKTPPSKSEFWLKMLGCLMTSQQKSGPRSQVARFLSAKPFPVSYKLCIESRSPRTLCTRALKEFGGIRFTGIIGDRAEWNLERLESGLWSVLFTRIKSMGRDGNRDTEREVADFIDDNLKGFGPKQSRNLLQWLGLTRYEIPLDSRVMKWLNDFGFPLKLNAALLSDRAAYYLIEDGVQALCAKAGVYPCILDAAIFASFDDKNPSVDVDEL